MNFGDKIREARKRNHYTQEQLANMVGVKKNTITGYEKNVREPSLEMTKKLAQALGVSSDYLIGITNSPMPVTYISLEDAEILAAAHSNLKDYAELPESIQALNILLAEHGYCIRRIDGEQEQRTTQNMKAMADYTSYLQSGISAYP